MTVWLYLTAFLLVGNVAVMGEVFKMKGLECWTSWFNYDDPTSDNGDFELITNIKQMNLTVCDNRIELEVQTLDGVSANATGQLFSKHSVDEGFICLNKDQANNTSCFDYRIRFKCPPAFCRQAQCWTDWFDRDDPSGSGDWETTSDLHAERPMEICGKPLDIEVRTVGGLTTKSTKDNLTISKEKGAICKTANNPKGCNDYKVRFLCPFEFCFKKECWTKWYDRGSPTDLVSWGVLAALKPNSSDSHCPKILSEIKAVIKGGATLTDKVLDESGKFLVNLYNNSDITYQVRYMCNMGFCDSS